MKKPGASTDRRPRRRQPQILNTFLAIIIAILYNQQQPNRLHRSRSRSTNRGRSHRKNEARDAGHNPDTNLNNEETRSRTGEAKKNTDKEQANRNGKEKNRRNGYRNLQRRHHPDLGLRTDEGRRRHTAAPNPNIRVLLSSLLLWMLMSTNPLCAHTHYTKHSFNLTSTLSPPSYSLSTAPQKNYSPHWHHLHTTITNCLPLPTLSPNLPVSQLLHHGPPSRTPTAPRCSMPASPPQHPHIPHKFVSKNGCTYHTNKSLIEKLNTQHAKFNTNLPSKSRRSSQSLLLQIAPTSSTHPQKTKTSHSPPKIPDLRHA